MRSTVILEFPSNLGLKEPSPGHEPGVKKLPLWLKEHGFHQLIDPVAVKRLEPPPYSMQMDPASGVRNADAIIAYAKQQAKMLEEVIRSGNFPLVIGGDCSILIGNALALKKMGRYGLFFLDGHHDFMWPSFSQTGGAAVWTWRSLQDMVMRNSPALTIYGRISTNRMYGMQATVNIMKDMQN